MPDDIMRIVRAKMLLDDRFVFFGTLAMNMEPVADRSIETARTDGSTLWYNPDYLASLSPGKQMTLCAHETLHPALGHCWRRGQRDPIAWNAAADFVINDILVEAGCEPIDGWLHDPVQFKNMSVEQVYSKLDSREEEQGKQASQGVSSQSGVSNQGVGGKSPATGALGQAKGVPTGGQSPSGSPTGDFVDGSGETKLGENEGMSESDWQIATEQAAKVAQAAGCLPGAFGRLLVQIREPKIDWVVELREFMAKLYPSDYSWSRPNRRWLADGLYLPGMVKDGIGEIVLGIDTSGSTMGMQEDFGREFSGVLGEARPEKVTVIYWDAKVQGVEEHTPDDFEVEYKPKGFGGTTPEVMFKYIEANELEPKCAIVLTDLEFYGSGLKDPGYPVLWCAPIHCTAKPPAFGQVLYIPKEN